MLRLIGSEFTFLHKYSFCITGIVYMHVKRSDKNTATCAVVGFVGPIDELPLPKGVTLSSDAEHTSWVNHKRMSALRLTGHGSDPIGIRCAAGGEYPGASIEARPLWSFDTK